MTNINLKKIKLVKKNRKYFAGKLIEQHKEYDCKIEIDKNSENLELDKELLLEVEDISIRSKYGVDLKFKLTGEKEEQEVIQFKSDYNKRLIKELKKLGAIFDNEEKIWIVSKKFEEEIEELDFIYNSEQKQVKITMLEDVELEEDLFNICVEIRKRDGKLKRFVEINGEWKFGGSNNYPHLFLAKDSWFVLNEKVEYIKLLEKENKFFKVEVL